MNIQNFFSTPAIQYVRPMGQPVLPTVRPVAPIETAAPAVEPQVALKSWLSQYSSGRDHGLYERVSADPSSEGTLFRRGLMISGVVSLA